MFHLINDGVEARVKLSFCPPDCQVQREDIHITEIGVK
ncbi:hypothetical protein C1A50_0089 [Paenibacillus polymyxa]|nr:hypothetical protein C1A50_0089 [Paenibacillus polymyxa]